MGGEYRFRVASFLRRCGGRVSFSSSFLRRCGGRVSFSGSQRWLLENDTLWGESWGQGVLSSRGRDLDSVSLNDFVVLWVRAQNDADAVLRCRVLVERR
eukprot:SAG31_NODE_1119_length_9813_cov_49.321289_5_plen_99_part_00